MHFHKGIPFFFKKGSKQPGQGKLGTNKSYDALLKNCNDALVLLKRRFLRLLPIDCTHFW